MALSIEGLVAKGQQLQKQFEAASNMAQQTAGAIAVINSLIQQLQKEHEEELKAQAELDELKEQKEQDDGHVDDQGEKQAA